MAPEIGEDELRTCLAQYEGLGEIASIAPPRESEWHGHNAIFRIECEAGEFYLKVLTTHPHMSTEEHYAFQDEAMAHFLKLGVRAPIARLNVAGRRLTPCGGYPAVLSAAVPGEEFHEEILSQQESAGRILGEFHRRAAAQPPRARSAFGPLGTYLLPDASVVHRLPDIPAREAIFEVADMLAARSRGIADEMGACEYHTLPRSIVHNDFTGVHLRVEGNRVCGVLDFEYVTWDTRVLDLGRSLTQLFCVGREAEADGPARTRAFLRGYNAAGWPVEPRELAALPLAVKTFDFEVVVYPLHQMLATGRPFPDFDLDHRLNYWLMRVRWWEEHAQEVGAQLLELEL